MEIYRQLGFSDQVRELGLPRDHPFDQAYFTRLSKHEIFRFSMPSGLERVAMRRDMPVTDQFPEPMFHVNQMFVERFLLQKVREAPNVDVRFGWEAQWFTQDEANVRVNARDTVSGREITWTAEYGSAAMARADSSERPSASNMRAMSRKRMPIGPVSSFQFTCGYRISIRNSSDIDVPGCTGRSIPIPIRAAC